MLTVVFIALNKLRLTAIVQMVHDHAVSGNDVIAKHNAESIISNGQGDGRLAAVE